jgi:hypothetical protein
LVHAIGSRLTNGLRDYLLNNDSRFKPWYNASGEAEESEDQSSSRNFEQSEVARPGSMEQTRHRFIPYGDLIAVVPSGGLPFGWDTFKIL